MSHPRKGFGLALFGALALLVSSASVASATVTHSTAAASPTFGFNDQTTAETEMRHVTGTTDGTSGDNVDIVCLNHPTDAPLVSGVGVAADGSVSADLPETKLTSYACRLAIVPAGPIPPDVSPFTGPLIGGGSWTTATTSGGTMYDFYTEQAHAKGYVDMHSIGRGGLYDMALQDSAGLLGNYLFYDNAYFGSGTHSDGGSGTRPDILVDGKPAYGSYNAKAKDSTFPGIPPAEFTHAVDPNTGDVVITEKEDLVACAPDEATCASFTPTGLRIERRIVQDHDGRVVTIRDVVRNTGNGDHAFDFDYEQYQNNDSTNVGFRFPAESAYAHHVDGDVVNTGFGDISTIGFVWDTANSTNDVNNPLGTLTVSPKPTRALFGGSDGFWLNFAGSIPAGGSQTITQAFSMGTSQPEVDTYAAGAADSQGLPTVAITDPAADGSTVSTANVTVKGTAADNNGIASLKLNGADVPVAGDGTWSAPVTLAEGANTLTAVVRDNAANEATATRTITYTKPPPPPVATVTKNGKVKVTRKGKKILVDTGIKVTCPPGPASCTAAASAKTVKAVAAKVHKSKVTVAKKTFTIAAGKTQKIVLTLSAKGAKALKRNKKLTIKVTVVTKVGNGAAQTTTRTIKIKQPKKAAKKH